MPPRKKLEVTQSPGRIDVLREFRVTEADIRELRRLPLEEALFRIGHERVVHSRWAARKADFLANEVRQSRQPQGERVVGGVVEFVDPRTIEGIGGTRLG